MNDSFIPILVEDGNIDKIWYLDVSHYSLEELMILKNQLNGTLENSIRMLDKIIYGKFCSYRNLYDTSDSRYRKEVKRDKKKLRQKKKFGGKKKW